MRLGTRRIVFPALLIPLFSANTSSVVQGDDRPPQTFAEIVEQNFGLWDKNQDGKLTAAETDQVLTDQRVTGAAAAAAAIHVITR